MNYFTRKRDAELHYSKLSNNNDILLVARDIAKSGAKNFVTVAIDKLYNNYIIESDYREDLESIIEDYHNFTEMTKEECITKYNKQTVNIIYILTDQMFITFKKLLILEGIINSFDQ